MKVLFVARHFTYFRNYESVIRLLAARGHVVHLAAERDESLGGAVLVGRLAADYPTVTFGEAVPREVDHWARLVTKLRLAFDYLRYLDPQYDGTPRLRSRAAERAPAFAARFGASAWARVGAVRAGLRTFVRAAESAIPPSGRITAFLREQRPDVMLITPLVGVVGSPQPDYVRAARALGIRSALCVWSWDHLSSKALIRDTPDRVFVWNDVQRDEAWRYHRVSADRVVVTGAQCFDHWFHRQPSRTREQFCAQAGLPADRPFVLYAGSALFGGSPSEAEFVLRWIASLRASADPAVRGVGVLVRPHPQRMSEWDGIDLTALPGVALWGGNPVTEEARADYFDSLFHSAAVVGLNTSAFLEAGIVGRPVFSILLPEFHENQEGTLHFRYLTDVQGGIVRVSRSLDEHVKMIGATLSAPPASGAHAAFIEAFIRPRGLGADATPVFAQHVEALASLVSRAARPVRSPLSRLALAAFAFLERSRRYQAWMMDEEDRRTWAWRRAKAEARGEHRRAGLSATERADAEREMRARRTGSQ